jgi:hypothetical protein
MIYAVPKAADRTVSRRNAELIASELDAKIVACRGLRVGEPQCPFGLRWNSVDFWFGLRFSDSAYVVEGNHKRRLGVDIKFFASLKTPDRAMSTKVQWEPLSSELGVAVFVSEPKYGPAAAAGLRSPECARMIRELQFEPIRSLFLSPVQIYAVSDLVPPTHCAQQARLMRSLLFSLFLWNSR